MVLVSIIIPTYNRKDLLIKAVESILLQTYSNWELLIINDYENPIKLNFNDTRITPITSNVKSMISPQAYCLFYQKKNVL